MPQTLLALAAILLFSLFAMSQHTATADAGRFAITGEVEMAAARLARQRLATVTVRAFDEADVGQDRVRTEAIGLSPLGPDDGVLLETSEADFDDVDDDHGAPARVALAPWMDESITFTDSVSVRYVAVGPSGISPSATPTLMKEVTVIVRAAPTGFVGTPTVAAVLSQVVTPTSH